jgi:hypothetical protein
MVIVDNGYTINDVAGCERIDIRRAGDPDTIQYTEINIHLPGGKVLSFDQNGLDDFIKALSHAGDYANSMAKQNED